MPMYRREFLGDNFYQNMHAVVPDVLNQRLPNSHRNTSKCLARFVAVITTFRHTDSQYEFQHIQHVKIWRERVGFPRLGSIRLA